MIIKAKVIEEPIVKVKAITETLTSFDNLFKTLAVDGLKIKALNIFNEDLGESITVPFATSTSKDDDGNVITYYYLSKNEAIETYTTKVEFEAALQNYVAITSAQWDEFSWEYPTVVDEGRVGYTTIG